MRKLACLRLKAVEVLLSSGVGQTLLGTLMLSVIICGIGIACGLTFGVLCGFIILIASTPREFVYFIGAIVLILAFLTRLKARKSQKKSREPLELGTS